MQEETPIPTLVHPHMDVLQKTLETQKTLLELLEQKNDHTIKIVGIYNGSYDFTKADLGATDSHIAISLLENKIKLIDHKINQLKLADQIKAQKRSVQIKEQYFVEYMKQFTIDANDCDKFYDIVVDKARKMATSNKNIKDIIDRVNWSETEKNIEVKIELFKRLVKLVK